MSAELSAAEVEARNVAHSIIAELPLSSDGTGHVVDCGWDDETMKCGCSTLPARIAALVAQAASERERALRERVEALCDGAERGEGEFILSSPGFSTYYTVEVGRLRAALSPEAASEVARG